MSSSRVASRWPLIATLAIMSVAVFVATVAWATVIGSQTMSTKYLVDRVTTVSINDTAPALVAGFNLRSGEYLLCT
jgi:hypothetical protein